MLPCDDVPESNLRTWIHLIDFLLSLIRDKNSSLYYNLVKINPRGEIILFFLMPSQIVRSLSGLSSFRPSEQSSEEEERKQERKSKKPKSESESNSEEDEESESDSSPSESEESEAEVKKKKKVAKSSGADVKESR